MAKKTDLDYLYASGRVRSLENRLINQERLRRMAEAASDAEALKVLGECGYGENLSLETLGTALKQRRQTDFADAAKMLPMPELLDIFRRKYDYHNIKTLIKGRAIGQAYDHLFLDYGGVPVQLLQQSAEDNSFGDLPRQLRNAAREAEEILNRTHDPRLADTALDRAMFAEMLSLAQSSGIPFLLEYVQLVIDSANLRAAVRLSRMGQDPHRLNDFYCEGGTIPLARLRTDLTPEALESVYANSPLAAAAQAGAAALRGESGLAQMDQAADNALITHLRKAKYVGFGAEPVLAYFAACDLESTAVQTVMAGRRTGLQPDTIMERLRMTYV